MKKNMPDKLKFSINVTNYDFIVRDLQMHNARAVPGVTFLDFIYRFLIIRGYDIQEIEIKNVLFKQPIITTEEYDQRIVVEIERNGDNYKFKGVSRRIKEGIEYGEWIDNMEGELHFTGVQLRKTIDIAELIEKSVRKTDMDECYVYSRKSGLFHYDFMKLLGTVHVGEGYLIADTRLGELAESYMDSFYLHPAFLDGSLAVPGASILRKVVVDYDNAKPMVQVL